MPRVGPGLLAAIALAAVAAALAWVVALQVLEPAVPQGPAGADAGHDDTYLDLSQDEGPMAPPGEILAEIVQRPVFSATRRPPPGKSVANSGATSGRPQSFDFELTGVVVTGDQKIALVLPRGSGETVQLKQGDTYRGWSVDEIGAGYVVLRARGREQIVYLAYKPPARSEQRE